MPFQGQKGKDSSRPRFRLLLPKATHGDGSFMKDNILYADQLAN